MRRRELTAEERRQIDLALEQGIMAGPHPEDERPEWACALCGGYGIKDMFYDGVILTVECPDCGGTGEKEAQND